jgi:copper transport protein
MTSFSARGAILLGAVALFAAAFALVHPGTARAHAILVRSDPSVNAELQVPPDQVVAYFSEALDSRLSSMRVVDGNGNAVDDGALEFGPEAERMAVAIDGDLAPGFYTVIWETLSTVDGHLFEGSFPFTVLNPDGTQPTGARYDFTGGGSSSTDLPDILVKWGQLVSLAALIGSLAFVAWVNVPATSRLDEEIGRRSRSSVRTYMWWIAGGAAGALAFLAVDELILQADQLGGFEYVGDVLKTDWGERWIQRQVTLAAVIVALFLSFSMWDIGRRGISDAAVWAALLGGLVYALLVAWVSHGNAVPGSFLAVGADFLHLVAASVWVGTLAMLVAFLLWLRTDLSDTDRADLLAGHLSRFSVIAATSVVVLLASGVVNGLTQIPEIASLADTAYGRALSLKLGVMCLLFAVAAVNAFYLRPRIVDSSVDGDPAPDLTRRLSTAVRIELALGVAVLVAAAVLILHPTARQLDDAEQATPAEGEAVVGYEEVQPTPAGIVVNLAISPNEVGQNSFRVYLFPQGGGDIGEVLRVRLRFDPPDGTGSSQVDMEPAGTNAYRAVGPFLTTPGGWDVHVDVRRADVDDVSVTFPVGVAAARSVSGGQFDFPLLTGSWLTIAALALLVLALVAIAWLTEWPGLPEATPRLLRVGTAALTVIGVGILVLSLLPESAADEGGNPIPADAQSIAIGRSLYTQNCATCHGDDGRGDGPQAPSLPVAPADFRIHIPYHQDEFFFQVMTNGLGSIMPAFGQSLTEEERWHLLNFLQSEFGADASQPAGQ